MPHIKFTVLGDLLAFLTACHARREALGATGQREKYSRITLGAGSTYAIRFRREDWEYDTKRPPYAYGGTIADGDAPAGKEIHLNDLLRRLPLLAHPFPGSPQSLVLAISQDGNLTQRPLEHLHQAWRHVPKLDGAESLFFVRRREGIQSWAAVQIHEVASQFDCTTLREFRGKGGVVFVPAWNEQDCYLFVEWGYAHSMPTEFALLYDDRVQDGKAEATRQLMLARAGKRVGDLRAANQSALYPANWTRVALRSHSLANELYELTLPPGEVSFAQVHAEQLEEEDQDEKRLDVRDRLDVRLDIGNLRDVVGAVDEIDRRIAQCSREIENLQTRKARLSTRQHTAWLPAYTFDQRNDEPLPDKLRMFLQRPLGELAQYRYAVVRGPEGRRHCLVGEVAVPWGAAMAVPSDTTWLCDTRWREWSLPLYLRADCVLTVEVDEENMAAKVRDLLADEGNLDFGNTDAVILTEPSDPQGGFTFCPLAPAETLDTALGFFNDEIGCQQTVAESIERKSEDLVREDDAVVSAEVQKLDETLQERAESLLAELENSWAATRERAMAALLQLRVTEAAVEIGGQACVESCEGWAAFVNHVLELDERISKVKREAAHRWHGDKATRDARIENVSGAQHDFSAHLAQSKAQLEAARQRMEAERQAIESALRELEAARTKAIAEAAALSSKAGELRGETRKTQTDLDAAKAELRKYEAELAEANSKRQQLEQTIEDSRRKYQQLDESVKQIKDREVTLEKLTARLGNNADVERAAYGELHRAAEEALRVANTGLAKYAYASGQPRGGWLGRLFGKRPRN